MVDCLFYIRLTGADTEDVRDVLSVVDCLFYIRLTGADTEDVREVLSWIVCSI